MTLVAWEQSCCHFSEPLDFFETRIIYEICAIKILPNINGVSLLTSYILGLDLFFGYEIFDMSSCITVTKRQRVGESHQTRIYKLPKHDDGPENI